jgi:twitching motility protein PilT
MVQHVNATQQKHIVTIENPIEFLHRDLNSSVTQREVGVDTDDVVTGLRAAMRQDPDVLVLGELADVETLDTAVKAAETGHLVVAAMIAPDAATAIDRAMMMYPPEQRDLGRVRLAESLRAVVAQQLLPRADERGRVPLVEVLLSTPEVRTLLRDPTRLPELRALMAESGGEGMQTFHQHLQELLVAQVVSGETAAAAADTFPGPPPARDRRKSGASGGGRRSPGG